MYILVQHKRKWGLLSNDIRKTPWYWLMRYQDPPFAIVVVNLNILFISSQRSWKVFLIVKLELLVAKMRKLISYSKFIVSQGRHYCLCELQAIRDSFNLSYFSLYSSLSLATFLNSSFALNIANSRAEFSSVTLFVFSESFLRHFRAYLRFLRTRRRFLNFRTSTSGSWRNFLFKVWIDIFSSFSSLSFLFNLQERWFRFLCLRFAAVSSWSSHDVFSGTKPKLSSMPSLEALSAFDSFLMVVSISCKERLSPSLNGKCGTTRSDRKASILDSMSER